MSTKRQRRIAELEAIREARLLSTMEFQEHDRLITQEERLKAKVRAAMNPPELGPR